MGTALFSEYEDVLSSEISFKRSWLGNSKYYSECFMLYRFSMYIYHRLKYQVHG